MTEQLYVTVALTHQAEVSFSVGAESCAHLNTFCIHVAAFKRRRDASRTALSELTLANNSCLLTKLQSGYQQHHIAGEPRLEGVLPGD